MEKVLLAFDESNYNSQVETVNSYLDEIQDAVNAFNTMGIGELSQTDFGKLFTQVDELVYDKMTAGKEISFGGLAVNKTQAMQIIEKPVGYEKLTAAVGIAVNALKSLDNDNHLRNLKVVSANQISTIYELDANGIAIVKSTIYDGLRSQNEKYATSSIAIKMFELATLLANKCEDSEIAGAIRDNGDGFSKIVKSIIKDHSSGSAELVVNIEGIIRYNQPGYKY